LILLEVVARSMASPAPIKAPVQAETKPRQVKVQVDSNLGAQGKQKQ